VCRKPSYRIVEISFLISRLSATLNLNSTVLVAEAAETSKVATDVRERAESLANRFQDENKLIDMEQQASKDLEK
jgi:hypothetical protein